jgi:hypothetical protein
MSAYQLRDITLVPEPTSVAMFGLGGAAALLFKLRRRKN